MSRKKKKNLKAPAFRSQKPSESDTSMNSALVTGIIMDILLIGLAVAMVWKLASIASNTMFFTDECFHNYIIRLTSSNWRVPNFLPDIYSGTWNNQPPLFHSIGTFFTKIFGISSLKYFNIFLLLGLLVGCYFLIRKFINANSARITLLLIMSSSIIHQFSVVLYLEILSGITFFLALFFLIIALEKKRYSFSICAGLSGSAMLLSKVTGIIILPFYIIFFGFHFFRSLIKHEKMPLIEFSTVVGVCLISTMLFLIIATDNPGGFIQRQFIQPVKSLVLPMFIGSSPNQSQGKNANEKEIMKPEEFWTIKNKGILLKMIYNGFGTLTVAGFFLAIIHSIIMLGKSRTLLILIFTIYGFFIFLLTPAAADRHFIALLPLTAFLGGYAISELSARLTNISLKWSDNNGIKLMRTINILLIICFAVIFITGTIAVANTGDLRAPLNQSVKAMLPAIEYIKNNTPEDSIVFTMWAYETLHYSGRRSTWGANAKGLRRIYFIEKPDELLEKCKEHGITHFLIDNNRIFPDEKYNTVVYTKTIAENLLNLIKQNKAEIAFPFRLTSENDEINILRLIPVIPQGKANEEKNISAYKFAFIIQPNRIEPLPDFFVITLKYEREISENNQ